MNFKKKENINFVRELLKSIAIGVLVFFVLYLFLWVGIVNRHNFIIYLSFSIMYSIGGYLPNKYLAIYLNKFIPWDKYPLKRLIYGVLFALILTFWVFVLLNYFQYFYFTGKGIASYLLKINFDQFKLPIYISTVMLLMFYSIYFYKELQTTKLNEASLHAENEKAKFNALKDQIDPHFLFNNLNVLHSIIDENPINAKRFVKNLSSIYRYILENKKSDLTSIKNEIEFAEKYLELLKIRFEDSLNYTIDVVNNESKIIPLASQILLENAVKHNKITDEHPLSIKIYDQDDYLIIENTYNPIQNSKGTKLGLTSINERCNYLLKKEIKVLIIENKHIVKVPISL